MVSYESLQNYVKGIEGKPLYTLDEEGNSRLDVAMMAWSTFPQARGNPVANREALWSACWNATIGRAPCRWGTTRTSQPMLRI